MWLIWSCATWQCASIGIRSKDLQCYGGRFLDKQDATISSKTMQAGRLAFNIEEQAAGRNVINDCVKP